MRALRESIAREAAVGGARAADRAGRRRPRGDRPRDPPRLAPGRPGVHPRELRASCPPTRGCCPSPRRRRPAPRALSLLELAERGTLFLEEVQRLPGDLQQRLARVLEAAVADRERGATPRPDVRVVASCSARSSRHAPAEAARGARAAPAAPAVARRACGGRARARALLRAPATPGASGRWWRASRSRRSSASPATAGRAACASSRACSSGRSPPRASPCSRSTRPSSTRGSRSARIASSRSSGPGAWARSGGPGTTCSRGRARSSCPPRAPRRARPGPGDRALSARGSRDRQAGLAAHRAPVRLRRERRRAAPFT